MFCQKTDIRWRCWNFLHFIVFMHWNEHFTFKTRDLACRCPATHFYACPIFYWAGLYDCMDAFVNTSWIRNIFSPQRDVALLSFPVLLQYFHLQSVYRRVLFPPTWFRGHLSDPRGFNTFWNTLYLHRLML